MGPANRFCFHGPKILVKGETIEERCLIHLFMFIAVVETGGGGNSGGGRGGVYQPTFMIKPNHLHPTKVCCALGLAAITKGFPSIGSAVLIT